jgi:hypothetical protein
MISLSVTGDVKGTKVATMATGIVEEMKVDTIAPVIQASLSVQVLAIVPALHHKEGAMVQDMILTNRVQGVTVKTEAASILTGAINTPTEVINTPTEAEVHKAATGRNPEIMVT